jgi:HEPN domain-containing protein
VALNSYASEVFRDQADQDYIAARSIYRLRFREQFLWSALQAIEKYLKAILLYNGMSSRYRNSMTLRGAELGHDIVGLLAAVQGIADIEFECPAQVASFISYLNHVGNNRYFDRATYTMGDEIHKLDEAVWHIRRFCQHLHFEVDDPATGRRDVISELVAGLKTPEVISKPWRFRLFAGLLEKILDGKNTPAREALVWKNLFYGHRAKLEVTYPPLTGSANPQLKER